MKIDNIYNFFFHPLNHKETQVKVLSTITVIALSILTAGIFLIAFATVNCCDRKIVRQNPKKNIIDQVAPPKINPLPVLSEKVQNVKDANIKQILLFEDWAAKGDWKRFRPEFSHYDWWTFPVSRPSAGHGDTYAVSLNDVKALKKDEEFMRSYRKGVELVVKSWGWDLAQDAMINDEVRTTDQQWTGYGVRLGKMADSLKLFSEIGLYQRLQRFYDNVCAATAENLEPWVPEALGRN